jgi:hypothetical protein
MSSLSTSVAPAMMSSTMPSASIGISVGPTLQMTVPAGKSVDVSAAIEKYSKEHGCEGTLLIRSGKVMLNVSMNNQKTFGSITPDHGGKDIFIHSVHFSGLA